MKLSLSEFIQYICQAKAAKETQLAKVYIFLFFSALMALVLCINFYRFFNLTCSKCNKRETFTIYRMVFFTIDDV